MRSWDDIRREFPSLGNWTYLNSATYGQVPACAVAAMNRYFARLEEHAASDFLSWYDDADRLRGAIGKLISAPASSIAFCGNASTALSWLLRGLEFSPGDEILTLEHEFPNNLYAPWFVPGVRFVETGWERFYESITPRTRLVLVSLLNYATGFRPPLEELSARLRDRGVLLYVDGTQGVGAIQFDCARIRPAMLAVHGYKWLLCPTGGGFAHVDPELAPCIKPPVVGWRSNGTWREVDNLLHGRPEFPDGAERFEGGGLPFTLLYAMEACVDLLLEIGPARIEQRVLELASQVRAILRGAGAEVAGGETPIVCGRFPQHDVSLVARRLRERRVVAAARHGHLRVSPHFYNNEADLVRLSEALREVL